MVGLIVEAVTGQSYGENLDAIVFRPAELSQTSFPTKPALPKPFIHGYAVQVGEPPD